MDQSRWRGPGRAWVHAGQGGHGCAPAAAASGRDGEVVLRGCVHKGVDASGCAGGGAQGCATAAVPQEQARVAGASVQQDLSHRGGPTVWVHDRVSQVAGEGEQEGGPAADGRDPDVAAARVGGRVGQHPGRAERGCAESAVPAHAWADGRVPAQDAVQVRSCQLCVRAAVRACMPACSEPLTSKPSGMLGHSVVQQSHAIGTPVGTVSLHRSISAAQSETSIVCLQ